MRRYTTSTAGLLSISNEPCSIMSVARVKVTEDSLIKVPIAISLCVMLAASVFAQGNSASSRITVNPGQQFQLIDGFGLNFTGPYFRADQKAMFDTLIDDLGASMFRVVPYLVYSNWEETNDNDDPNVMNWEYYNDRYSTPIFEATWSALRYLNSRGIRPVIALMGPVPDWMTDVRPRPPSMRSAARASRPPGRAT
jgi:hypothetical protein